MKITTKCSTNGHSAGRITARCGRRQLTVTYDHALSASANHATAAAMLASKLKLAGVYSMAWHQDNGCLFNRVALSRSALGVPCEVFEVGEAVSAYPYVVFP